MIDFFRLASNNLLKATALVFAIFIVILGLIALALVIFKDNVAAPEWRDVFLGVTFNFGLTLFIMLIAFFSEYREYAAFRSAMSKNPFNNLTTLGFREVKLFNQRFPWKLYKPVMLAQAGGFMIVAETKTRTYITFSFLAWNVQHANFNRGIENHRGIRLISTDYGVAMTVPVDSVNTPGLEGLNQILTGIVPFIQKQGYTPMHDLSAFEKVLKREMLQQGITGA